jgi:hypothetical protein
MADDRIVQQMVELGTRHADPEAQTDIERIMATVVAEPVYEFHPLGLRVSSGQRVCAGERCVRLVAGELFEELEPIG